MELFAAVCRTGSVTYAAAATGMSQPAASAMLRQMESRLGFELFTRRQRRLELTSNGRMLLPDVTHALAALDSVERLAESMGRKRPGRLIMGAISAAGASILPPAVHSLQREHPHVTVVLRSGTATEVVEWAASQRIDLGVVLGSAVHEHVGFQLLADLHLVCAMPRRHPLARQKEVTLEQLASGPYVAHSRYLPIGALTAAALEAEGLKFQPAIEVSLFSAACAFSEAGCGVAVLDNLTGLYAQQHGLAVRRLRAPGSLSLSLVWPLARGLNIVAKQFVEYLRQPLAQLA
ncbi:DNA-binding transcriptional LysR family regulator [Variovorax paradoxus]|uniref:LysR family transcriptional regulator n=1 Tax=Variovorax paradoxus TaxID=34073 RepID=UPI00278551A7|nr:LysR family transcriptional regulator [Variovorax paradoxus]MDP9962885.1 DNA-binding transcriptional LysR family regulator [Variovorax paradoxus]